MYVGLSQSAQAIKPTCPECCAALRIGIFFHNFGV